MTAAAVTPPSEAEERPLSVDWSAYAQTAELTESVRETGDLPATVPDRLVVDGLRTIELDRSSWSVTCTGNGVAAVVARVRARELRVVRDLSPRPRVFLSGVRILMPDSAIPDVAGVSGAAWVEIRFYVRQVTVTPAGAT